MGFSPKGNMVGSTAIVGWVGADGASVLRKYFLGGQSSDLVRVQSSDQGIQMGNSSVVVQSNQIYIAFQLSSDNPSTRLIYAVGPARQLPVGPNFRLSKHRTMVSTVLNYATGQFQTQQRPEASLRRSHGLLNMLGWAILLPIGAMVARYTREWDPFWFYAHATFQSLGFILGVAGVICGFVLQNRLHAPNVDRHKGLGIFILVLGCLQVLAFLARPDKTSKVRKYWNWYHFGVGRALIFLAAVNVFYGIHLGKPGSSWNVGFAIVLVLLFVISLILELRMWFRK